jgi:hypothetical protein
MLEGTDGVPLLDPLSLSDCSNIAEGGLKVVIAKVFLCTYHIWVIMCFSCSLEHVCEVPAIHFDALHGQLCILKFDQSSSPAEP